MVATPSLVAEYCSRQNLAWAARGRNSLLNQRDDGEWVGRVGDIHALSQVVYVDNGERGGNAEAR